MREAPPTPRSLSFDGSQNAGRLISSMNGVYSCTQARMSSQALCPKKSMDCSIASAFKFTFFMENMLKCTITHS